LLVEFPQCFSFDAVHLMPRLFQAFGKQAHVALPVAGKRRVCRLRFQAAQGLLQAAEGFLPEAAELLKQSVAAAAAVLFGSVPPQQALEKLGFFLIKRDFLPPLFQSVPGLWRCCGSVGNGHDNLVNLVRKW